MYILHIMHPESISDIFGKASVTKRIIPVTFCPERVSLLYESEPKKNAEPPKVLRIHKIKRGRRTYTQYYMSLVHLQKIRFFHIQRSNISMFLFQA